MLSHFLRTVAADDDPDFRNVTLLLPGNGTNGAQNNTFLDSGTANGGVGFTITRNGNTTQGTFSPYGPNWSNYFDGNGDYLSVPDNAAFDFSAGVFTIETFICPQVAQVGRLFSQQGTSGTGVVLFRFTAGRQLEFTALSSGGATLVSITTTATITLNTWAHVAVVRNSNTFTIYINGVSSATATASVTLPNISEPVLIGAYSSGPSEYFSGYISNYRVVKGTAVYTSDFTPPTAPLTAVANTSLLTCQSNRFIDNSSNNFTITRNGDVSVQRFSPFNPTGAYESTVLGGSGYFDGTGDYLSVARNTAFVPGSNEDFTFEAWIYLTSTPSPASQVAGIIEAGLNGDWEWLVNGGLQTQLWIGSVNTSFVNTATLLTLNSWNHIAISRSGTASNNLKIFVNGVGQSFTTNASLSNSTTYPLSIGSDQNGDENLLRGYISNLRLVKGTAVYTANFTPPTAPLTAITNTSLLLNFTNAGVIDNSALNNLETVGNAQISTAQSRFGGSSISFDGTGDYLVSNAATTDLYAFGTGDFTIEFWLYLNALQNSTIYDNRPASTNGAYPTIYLDINNILTYYANTANRIVGATLANSTWYHVAVCRSGTSTRMFLNGTQTGSTYTDSTNYLNASGRPFIGASSSGSGSNSVNGYIDDLRITKGIARYTANFTPPVRPFPTR